MTQVTFQAIRRPEIFVGREELLDKIYDALTKHQQHETQTLVIAIRGRGGYGKTRLLEEVLIRLGRDDILPRLGLTPQEAPLLGAWKPGFKVRYVPSDILDFALPELSVRSTLLRALRESLRAPGRVDFNHMDYWGLKEQRALAEQRSFAELQRLQQGIERAFRKDLQENVRSHTRPVWAWDTVERLATALNSPIWRELADALGRPLLDWEEADFITGPWLLDRLQKGLFNGAVLLLAGRPEEGEAFWNALEETARASKAVRLVSIDMPTLNEEEVRQFFVSVHEVLTKQQPESEGPLAQQLQERTTLFRELTQNARYVRTLTSLTEGKPVLLSIFADVLMTAPVLPIPFADLVRRLEDLGHDETLLGQYRARIEGEFVASALRRGEKDASLEGQMLLALARSPRGLDREQFQFLLTKTEPQEDLALKDIAETMKALLRLTIVKQRPCPPGMHLVSDIAENFSQCRSRITLQDEVLRIFAEYMSEPRDTLMYEEEKRRRQEQYELLLQWSEKHLEALKAQRLKLFREQLRSLNFDSPLQVLQSRWEVRSDLEERIAWVQRRIRFWELEHLHYHMLLEPTRAWNAEYLDLAETHWYNNNLAGDIVLQAEILALIQQHKPLLHFSDMPEDDSQSPQDLKRLCQAIRTEGVTRWIKRLIAGKRVQLAVDLAERVEEAIRGLSPKKQDKEGWMHPLNWGERRIWHTYGRILLGEEPSLGDLEEILKFLEELLRAPWCRDDEPHKRTKIPARLKKIDPNGELLPEGTAGLSDHPAGERVRRILAVGYNFLGYGYVVRGEFAKGRAFYKRSLQHMQHIQFPAQEAATRNNIGRALAEMGRVESGLQMVYQALALREQMASWIPYAYSLNTAALINNDNGRVMRGLGHSARAAAIFRRLGDYRGLGMALIEVALAARRHSKMADPGLMSTVVGSPESWLTVASQAIDEALEIFAEIHCAEDEEERSEVRGVCEPIRLFEALLQRGEILQDKMRFATSPSSLNVLYEQSLDEIRKARKISRRETWSLPEAKALIDEAETHYWYAYYLRRQIHALKKQGSVSDEEIARLEQKRDAALEKGMKITAMKAWAQGTYFPHDAVILEGRGKEPFAPPNYSRGEYAHFWKLLSKRHRFEAGLRFERLLNRHLNDTWHDSVDPKELAEIARNFVKAALYGRLFGDRTRIIRRVYRFLSRYLDELRERALEWRKRGQTSDAKNLHRFMHQFYVVVREKWEWYHQGIHESPSESSSRSIYPPPEEVASLPLWLEEVYLFPWPEAEGESDGE